MVQEHLVKVVGLVSDEQMVDKLFDMVPHCNKTKNHEARKLGGKHRLVILAGWPKVMVALACAA